MDTESGESHAQIPAQIQALNHSRVSTYPNYWSTFLQGQEEITNAWTQNQQQSSWQENSLLGGILSNETSLKFTSLGGGPLPFIEISLTMADYRADLLWFQAKGWPVLSPGLSPLKPLYFLEKLNQTVFNLTPAGLTAAQQDCCTFPCGIVGDRGYVFLIFWRGGRMSLDLTTKRGWSLYSCNPVELKLHLSSLPK